MTHDLNYHKGFVERRFKDQNEPIPEGCCITYNSETELVKVFLDGESYGSLADKEDVILTEWLNNSWKDK